MFEADVVVVFVPEVCLSALQACAVPVLRQHQHDDVLPDLPEEAADLPQYTLHRPSQSCIGKNAAWSADAADAFHGTQQHEGLVVTASRCTRQLATRAGVLSIHSGSNR